MMFEITVSRWPGIEYAVLEAEALLDMKKLREIKERATAGMNGQLEGNMVIPNCIILIVAPNADIDAITTQLEECA